MLISMLKFDSLYGTPSFSHQEVFIDTLVAGICTSRAIEIVCPRFSPHYSQAGKSDFQLLGGYPRSLHGEYLTMCSLCFFLINSRALSSGQAAGRSTVQTVEPELSLSKTYFLSRRRVF